MTDTVGDGDLDRLFADLVRCETRLYNALDDVLRRQHGLVTSQYEFLGYVRAHPAARVADLAAEFAVGVGATSRGIDRLEARGWVQRRAHPTDRRSSALSLTDEGAAVLDAARLTVHAELDRLLRPAASATDLATAREVLARLRAALEQEGLGTPSG